MLSVAAFLALTLTNVLAVPPGIESVLVPGQSFLPNQIYRRAISPDVVLKNGQLAQSQNAKYAGLTLDSPCQVGDKACIQGGFAQCVAGKYLNIGCAPPTACFELPLLLKAGSVPSCTTPEDAATRIANSGAKGGVKGDGANSAAADNTTSPASGAPAANTTAPATASPAANATAPASASPAANATESTSHDGTDMEKASASTPVEDAKTGSATSSDSGSAANATSTTPAEDDSPAKNATTLATPSVDDSKAVAGNQTAEAEDEECTEE